MPFSLTITAGNDAQKKAFEYIMNEGENAGNHNVFYPKKIVPFVLH